MFDLIAKDPNTCRVEGGDPHISSALSYQLMDSLFHLTSSLIGEGDGEDLPRGDATFLEQMCDPPR